MFRPPDPTPTQPSPEEVEEARGIIANGMLELRDSLTPAFDAADGMRADLLRRGWSREFTEAIVVTWLQRVVANMTPLIGSPQ